jgi:hypothetical protein
MNIALRGFSSIKLRLVFLEQRVSTRFKAHFMSLPPER